MQISGKSTDPVAQEQDWPSSLGELAEAVVVVYGHQLWGHYQQMNYAVNDFNMRQVGAVCMVLWRLGACADRGWQRQSSSCRGWKLGECLGRNWAQQFVRCWRNEVLREGLPKSALCSL